MKKNIVIGLLVVLSAFSLSFGWYQKKNADKIRIIADQNAAMAVENAERARMAEMEASRQLRLAEEQRMIAQFEMQRAIEAAKRAEESLAKTKRSK